MELALSLGDGSRPFSFLERDGKSNDPREEFNFRLGLGNGDGIGRRIRRRDDVGEEGGRDTSLQLNLLPFCLPLPNDDVVASGSAPDSSERGPPVLADGASSRLLVVTAEEDELEGPAVSISSPTNGSESLFQLEFGVAIEGGGGCRRYDAEGENGERGCLRGGGSDDEDNGLVRKKLRLSKEQSVFLEESFKEQSTLNPKQKLALAKQLNLRPRQVEVWFQNRRARTKLKQTEVDCEHLKRWCETLTQENRRLHKELQELRALKTASPFHARLPATTLTMCPSCERVQTAITTTSSSSSNPTIFASPPSSSLSLARQPSTSSSNGGRASSPRFASHVGFLPASAVRQQPAS